MNNHLIKGLILLFVILASNIQAQNFSESFWYFGDNNAAIQFDKNADRNANLIENQATPFGNGGAAVAAHGVDGQLLFYTDGQNVYGKNHQILPDGDAIGGNNALRHPAAIIPSLNPNDNIFHLYIINAANELQLLNVDMSLGDFGEVTSSAQGTGFSNVSDYLNSYRLGDSYFLIFQDNNSLELVQVQNNGTLSPVASHNFSIEYF